MTSKEQLSQLSHIDINSVDGSELVDIKTITFDKDLDVEKRFTSFLDGIKNPYIYKCGKTVVKIDFACTNVSLSDRLTNHFLHLRNR